MTAPFPFALSSEPPKRRHGPQGYANYRKYKDWLRDEFVFRCAYCLERERWYPSGHAGFGVDHVLSQAAYAALICIYENLVYACNRCNTQKQGRTVLDPSRILLAHHLHFAEDGSVLALSDKGEDLILTLDLNHPQLVMGRWVKLELWRLKQESPEDSRIDALFLDAFGFPDDLPNLESLHPSHNSRPEGLQESYYRQRIEGRLPEVY